MKCYNIYTQDLLDIVDQTVIASPVIDGTVIYCYDPITTTGASYSADNFKIFKNGAMLMMDDSGNWSKRIRMYRIPAYQLSDMLRKYGLD